MSRKLISQNFINVSICCLFMIVVFTSVVSIAYMRECIEIEKKTVERKNLCEKYSDILENYSDYLTEEVRKFAVNKDKKHLFNYWYEVKYLKHREKAIDTLEKLDLSEDEMKLVNIAKENSDLLMYTETRAMKLICEAMGLNETSNIFIPKNVNEYILNVEEKKMNSEEKVIQANKILFDNQYSFYKETISGNIDNFRNKINKRLNREVEEAGNQVEFMITAQIILLCLSAFILIVIMFIFYRLMVKPIVNYSKRIESISENDVEFLKPQGAKEMRVFAGAFNHVYYEMIRAGKAKSEFTAVVSHELRTPLNSIIGYEYLLGKTDMDTTQKEYLANIKIASKNLLTLINNVLDLSKLNENKFEIENTVFNILECLEETKNIYRYTAESKGLYIRLESAKNIPTYVNGDKTKFVQIINNIVSNALKFTYEGGVSINIHCNYINLPFDNGVRIVIAVKDTGIGIKKQQLDKIFLPFEQADSSISGKFGGTGLGLSICKKIAELMGGTITVESAEGAGATFIVKIPFEIYSGNQVAVEKENERQDKIFIGDYTGKKALLVEDNKINRVMESQILKDIGFFVSTASSGKQAIEKAIDEKFDIIFMDIRIGDMSGFEAFYEITQKTLNKNTYCVALTADVEEKNIKKAFQSGMNDILTKPLEIKRLSEVLEKWSKSTKKTFVNVDDALYRFQNNKKLFNKMLLEFFEKRKSDFSLLERLINDKNFLRADDLLHDLKGVSGSLGLTDIYNYVVSFRDYLKNTNDYNLASEYVKELKRLFDDTYKVYYNISTKDYDEKIKEKNICNSEDFKRILETLSEFVFDNDLKALEYFEENESVITAFWEKDKIIQFKTALSKFDFEKTAEILKAG